MFKFCKKAFCRFSKINKTGYLAKEGPPWSVLIEHKYKFTSKYSTAIFDPETVTCYILKFFYFRAKTVTPDKGIGSSLGLIIGIALIMSL